MTEEEKKEFEEFLKWKAEKAQQAASKETEEPLEKPVDVEDVKLQKNIVPQTNSTLPDSDAPHIGLYISTVVIAIVLLFITSMIVLTNSEQNNLSETETIEEDEEDYVEAISLNEEVAPDRAYRSKQSETSSSTITSSAEVKNNKWNGGVKQVENYLERTLRDPDSYESIEWSEVKEKADGYYVRHKYRAKNGFGGYVVANQLFHLDFSGNVVNVKDLY